MLTIKSLTRKDINKTVHYYADGADDYYTGKGDASAWFGKGALLLDLNGNVTKKAMQPLLLGHISQATYSRASTRNDQKDRIAYDLTFSAPKSLSLQALIGGDSHIIACHDHAVKMTLITAERFAQARVKVKGMSRTETTGNLIVAQFRHEISRAGDPQLHTHAVVMNLTQRRDGHWRSLKNDGIVKRILFLRKTYDTTLAQELTKRGYKLRYGKYGLFEIDSFKEYQLRAFSQRSQQVESLLEQKGLTRNTASTSQKQQATLQSRVRKSHIRREDLLKKWKVQAEKLNIEIKIVEKQLSPLKDISHDTNQKFEKNIEEVHRHLRSAIHDLTERYSSISEKDLITIALQKGQGYSSREDIQSAISRSVQGGSLILKEKSYRSAKASQNEPPKTRQEWIDLLKDKGVSTQFVAQRVDRGIEKRSLIVTDNHYTTPQALDYENHILQIENRGRDSLVPLIGSDKANDLLKESSLKEEQKQALHMVLTTPHRIIGIQGFEGVVKSNLLKACYATIYKEGHDVEIVAPYTHQVKNLKKLGITACTAASFWQNSCGRSERQKVLIIDEANSIPTRVMKKIVSYSEKNHIRIVLLESGRKMSSIEASKPFLHLKMAGITTLCLEDIQRQKIYDLKAPMQHENHSSTKNSLKSLSQMTEIKSSHERYVKMAQDYRHLTLESRHQAILLTETNRSCIFLNQLVRKELGLIGKGQEVQTLRLHNLTSSQKAFITSYHVGDFLRPEKDYKKANLTKDTLYQIQVLEAPNYLIVSDENGHLLRFNPAKCRSLSVYGKENIELSLYDQVRINSRDKRFFFEKGDTLEVNGINTKDLLLKDRQKHLILPTKELLPLNYAYASTLHESQNRVFERVFLDFQTHSEKTIKDLSYMAISKARVEARLYTDDIKALPTTISRCSLREPVFERVDYASKEKKDINYPLKEDREY